MSQLETPNRLTCLLDLERYETRALAAQVRYVRMLIAQIASEGLEASSLDGCADLSIRLDTRAGELERLAKACEGPPPALAAADAREELLFGPVATLVGGYEMRAMGLEYASTLAREFGHHGTAVLLQRQLRQTEADGRLILTAVSR